MVTQRKKPEDKLSEFVGLNLTSKKHKVYLDQAQKESVPLAIILRRALDYYEEKVLSKL